MLYSDIFLLYKETGSRWKILMNVRNIRKRFIRAIILCILSLGNAVFLLSSMDYIYPGLCFWISFVLMWISLILLMIVTAKIDKLDIVELRKKHNQISFTEAELANRGLFLDKLQKEWVEGILSEKMNDANYIKRMIEYSKESIDISKVQFASVKEIGITAAVLILLNNYFEVIYKKLEALQIREITLYTLLFLAALCGVLLFYHIAKSITLDWLNTDHRHHKRLYMMLRHAEDRAALINSSNSNL